MNRIIGFAVGTVAVLAFAVGFQAFGTTGHDEEKDRVSTSQSPDLTDSQTAPSGAAAQASAPSDPDPEDAQKPGDDSDRAGFTEDHGGKPGESK